MPRLKKAELIEGRVYIPIHEVNGEGVFLEHGMQLDEGEFLRRYRALPAVKKAELIEGVVYMPSPVRHTTHGLPHAQVMGWLGVYWSATPGVEVSDNATLRLAPRNIPQPDALVRITPPQLGATTIDEDNYLRGAPELLVEIAGSSAAYDLNEKLALYQARGGQEYIVWQMYEGALAWLQLCNGHYERLSIDEAGVIRSAVLPGLWLAVDALLRGDLAAVLAELQKGFRSPEHAAFVQQLAAADS